ncbi:MAG: hypothetical protein ACK5CW_04260, partial [Verrucomicrobiota bacterium]
PAPGAAQETMAARLTSSHATRTAVRPIGKFLVISRMNAAATPATTPPQPLPAKCHRIPAMAIARQPEIHRKSGCRGVDLCKSPPLL